MTQPIYFCHGLPGSPRDAEFPGQDTLAPDLLAAPDPLAQFDALTASMDKPIHLAGFSIGARTACLIAAYRPNRIAKLSLISAGVPLQSGDYLSDMAGRPVFLAALKSEAAIQRLAWWQALSARHAPRLMLRALFAKTGTSERVFAQSQRDVLSHGLTHSLIRHRDAYTHHLRAYVADWSDILPQIQCGVDIHHGTQDKWAPVAMAHALKAAIPQANLHLTENEHYTTLAQVTL